MARDKTLIWTRSRRDAPADLAMVSALLAAAGKPAPSLMHIPCLELKPLPFHLAPEHYDCVVFTSANAVEFVCQDSAAKACLAQAPSLVTHGAKTAEALAVAGLTPTLAPGTASGAELCSWLGRTLPRGARVLCPGAAEPAFPMVEGLQALGIDAVALVCYHTEALARTPAGQPWQPPAVALLREQLAGVICFASPSAVLGFAKVFAPAEHALGTRLVALALGATTAAAAAEHFACVDVAPRPDMRSLAEAAAAFI